VRLTEEQNDAIQAAVFVRELRSPQVLFEPLLEALATELLADAGVAEAVKLRRKRRRAGVVQPLERRFSSPRPDGN